jgi:hypothetical protein
MREWIDQKKVVKISFYIHLVTWVLWIILLRYFGRGELSEILVYSIVAFSFALAYKLVKNRLFPLPEEACEVHWPVMIVALHLVPFFILFFVLCTSRSVGRVK